MPELRLASFRLLLGVSLVLAACNSKNGGQINGDCSADVACPGTEVCDFSSGVGMCIAGGGVGDARPPIDAHTPPDASPPPDANEGVPPDTTITPAVAAYVPSGTIMIAFTSTKTPSTFQCSVDHATYAACTTPATVGPLADGVHTFEVYAVDQFGQKDATPASASFTVDTVLPDTTILDGPNGSVTTSDATFTFDSTEAGTFKCKLDAQVFMDCASPKAYTTLALGTHTFTVEAIDLAGNIDPTPPSRSWAVVSITPDTTITSGPLAATTAISGTFTFTSSVADSTFVCTVDGGAPFACTTPFTTPELAEGPHVFTVDAIAPGNVADTTPAVYSWEIDLTGPNAYIISGPNDGGFAPASVSFTYSTRPLDDTATFLCALTLGSRGAGINDYVACPKTGVGYASLINAQQYTFSVKAVDVLGNLGPPASSTFTVDLSGPVVAIQTPAAGSTVGSAFVLDFSYTAETGATFVCTLAGGAVITDCQSGQLYTMVAAGQHTITVVGTDTLGNVGPPATSTFTVAPLPDVAIQQPSAGETTAATATVIYSHGTSTTIACTLDGGIVACDLGDFYTYSGLSNGSHTFTVQGFNQFGEPGATATVTWNVDANGPVMIIAEPSDPNAGGDGFTCPNGQIQLTCDPARSDIHDCPPSQIQCGIDTASLGRCDQGVLSFSGLSDGAHSAEVRALDFYSNVGPTVTKTWTVDGKPPTFSISLPSGAQPTGDFLFTVSSNEPLGTHVTSCILSRTNGGVQEVVGPCARHVHAVEGGPPVQTYGFDALEGAFDPYTVTVTIADACGNPQVESFSFITDNTPPVVTFTGPVAAPATSCEVGALSWTSDDEAATYTCSIDGASPTACTSPLAYGDLTGGSHSATIVATDAADNSAPYDLHFAVDTIAPDVTISSPTASQVVCGDSGTVAVFYAADPVEPATTAFTCTADPAGTPLASSTCTASSATFTGLAQGTHTVQIAAVDTCGNAPASQPSVSFIVDTAAPIISGLSINSTTGAVAGPPAEPAIVCSAQFIATYAISDVDPATARHCFIDGAEQTGCGATSFSVDGLSDAVHTFSLTATDGCHPMSTASVSFRTKTALPTIASITPPTTGGTTGTTLCGTAGQVAITENPAEPSTTGYTCSLDGVTTHVTACDQTGLTFSGLSDAAHPVAITATDVCGRSSPSATTTFTTDTTAPTVTFDSGTQPDDTGSDWLCAAGTATFKSNDASATFMCSIDSGTAVACLPGTTIPPDGEAYTGQTTGLHTFHVLAVDQCHDGAGVDHPDTFNVSTVAPTISDVVFTGGKANTSGSDLSLVCTNASVTGTFTVAHDNPNTQVLCSVSGTTSVQANCSLSGTNGTFTLVSSGGPTLRDGSYNLSIFATDGCTSEAIKTVTFTVKTTTPTVSALTITDGGAGAPSSRDPASVNLCAGAGAVSYTSDAEPASTTYACTVAGIANPACTASGFSFASLTSGSHAVTVTISDACGRAAVGTATIKNDTTAPSLTLPSLSPTLTGKAYSFPSSFTATDDFPSAGSAPLEAMTCGVVVAGGARVHDRLAIPGNTCSASLAGTTGSLNGNITTDGTYALTVTATDACYTTVKTSTSFTVDSTPPVISFVSPSPAIEPTFNPKTGNIHFTATDSNGPLSITACTLDGATVSPCTIDANLAYGPLGDGAHTFSVTVADAEGNPATGTLVFDVDATGPVVTFSAPTTLPAFNPKSGNIQFAASDAHGGAVTINSCTLDGVTYAGATCAAATNLPYTNLAEAGNAHAFIVNATDLRGNSTTAELDFNIDATGPVITFSSPTTLPAFNAKSGNIQFATSDAHGGAVTVNTCTLNGATYSGATCAAGASLPYTNLNEAANPQRFIVTATDARNNATTAEYDFNVASTGPTVVFNSPTSLPAFNPKSGNLDFTATDSHGGTVTVNSCTLDGATVPSCVAGNNLPYSNLLDSGNAHKFIVTVSNSTGNSTTAEYDFNVDSTGPLITFSSPTTLPAFNPKSGSLIFATSDADGGAVTINTCTLNGATVPSCVAGNSLPYTNLAEAGNPQKFIVTATDARGNPTTAEYDFNVDSTGPTITFVTPTTLPAFNAKSGNLNFTATDTHAGTVTINSCTLNGATVPSCVAGNNLPYSNLVEASNPQKFIVTATDARGNQATNELDFNVDSTGPVVTFNSPTTLPAFNAKSGNLNFGAVDAHGGTVTVNSCTLDGATVASCVAGNNLAYGPLSDAANPHKFIVTVTDIFSNSTIAELDFNVASTGPTITFSAPTSQPAFNPKSGNIQFAATAVHGGLVTINSCTLNGATYIGAVCAAGSNLPYTNLSDSGNPQKFIVTATDSTGNSTTAEYDFNVDSTGPVVTFNSPTTLPAFNAKSGNLNFSASDANGGTVTINSCTLNGTTVPSCVAGNNLAYGPLAEASNPQKFIVTATDARGNQSTNELDFDVDSTGPTITFVTPTTLPAFNAKSGNLDFAASDTHGGAVTINSCTLNGTTVPSCAAATNLAYGPLNEASNPQKFIVTATDIRGNQATNELDFNVDSNGPVVTFNSPTTLPAFNPKSGNLNFTATDGHGGAVTVNSCTLNGTTVASCVSGNNLAYGPLAEASNPQKFIVTVTDVFNNSATAELDFNVDSTGPTIAFTSPTTLPAFNPKSGNVVFSASDTHGGTVTINSCTLNGTTVPSCVAGNNLGYGPLNEAINPQKFIVNATDARGNPSTTEYDFNVDSVGPVIGFSTPTSLPATNPVSGNLLFSANDNHGGTVTINSCTINGVTFLSGAACTAGANHAYGPLSAANNPQQFAITATDARNNQATTTLNFNVLNPPVVSNVTCVELAFNPACEETRPIHAQSDPNVDVCAPTESSGSQVCTFDASGGNGSLDCECQFDGTFYPNCQPGSAGGLPFNELSPGQHTFGVDCLDAFDNDAKGAATFNEVLNNGEGDVVLIGHDFSTFDGKGTEIKKLLGNSVALTYAYNRYCGQRYPKVRGVKLGPVNTTARTNAQNTVLQFIQSEYGAGVTIDDVYLGDITSTSLVALQDGLVGADILLIYDQVDPSGTFVGSVAVGTWKDTLRNYVASGGVIISLDGTTVGAAPQASNTWKLLHNAGLIGVSDLSGFGNGASCAPPSSINYDDVALGDAGQVVGYGAPATSVLFHDTDLTDTVVIAASANGQSGLPIVLHKHFYCEYDYVVSVNGNDAKAGDCFEPSKTITRAISLAAEVTSPNILVLPGSYNANNGETFPVVPPINSCLVGSVSSAGRPVSCSGEKACNKFKAQTLIAGGGTFAGVPGNMTVLPRTGATVEGFEISNPTTQPAAPGVIGVMLTTDSVNIENNTIGNIGLTEDPSDGTFPSAIYMLGATGANIINNTILDNLYGITVSSSGGGGDVWNNLIEDNFTGVLIMSTTAPNFGDASNPGGNDFVCNSSGGFSTELAGSDFAVKVAATVLAEGDRWDTATTVAPTTNGDIERTTGGPCSDGADVCISNASGNVLTTTATRSSLSCARPPPSRLFVPDDDSPNFSPEAP